MMDCLLKIAENLRTPTIKDGVSDSIILFGSTKAYGDVVFKITPDSNPNTNSLEVERDVYMFVKRVLSQSTPHFAKGLEIGKCELQSLFNSENDFFSTVFKEKWIQLRGGSIYFNANEDQSLTYNKYFNRKYNPNERKQFKLDGTYFAKLYETVYEISTEPRFTHIHYIMTSKMNGVSLSDYFTNHKIVIDKDLNFELQICIQVAQALCAAEQEGFMHNDLHTGNVFIHKLNKFEDFHYTIPFEFTLRSQFFITIFDYDFSSYRGGPENTSLTNLYKASTGASNDYVKNYDWYYFISWLMRDLESIRKTFLRTYIGGTYGNYDPHFGNKGQFSYFGRACVCTEEDKTKEQNTANRCTKCQLNTTLLDSFISPVEFLLTQVKTNPLVSTPTDEKKSEIIKDNKKAEAEENLNTLVDPINTFKNYQQDQDQYENPLDWLKAQKKQQQAKREQNKKYKPISFSKMGKQTKNKKDLF